MMNFYSVTHRKNIFMVVLVFLLTACNMPGNQQSAQTVFSVVINTPANGAQYNVGDLVDVQASVSAPSSVAISRLLVNGESVREDVINIPMTSGQMYQPWRPDTAGTYTLMMVIVDAQGNNLESNIITIIVGGESETITTTTEGTRTSTPEPNATPTPTLGPAVFTSEPNANCRSGPSTVFRLTGSIGKGQTVPIVGIGASPYQAYWIVDVNGNNCWVWSELGQPSGDYQNVPVIESPPFPPTATPTSVPIPTPVPISPSGALNCADVTGGTTLKWSVVSHPAGIDHYEWALEGPTNESGNTAATQIDTSGGGLFCAGANYKWRVRAVDGNGNIGPWSEFMSFNVP